MPCLVVDGDAATESSLAENAVRIAMHPADQVGRVQQAGPRGRNEPNRSPARFGVAERTVQKRVRLGGLPDEIIGAYREGRINADTAEAFAVTADTEFQRKQSSRASRSPASCTATPCARPSASAARAPTRRPRFSSASTPTAPPAGTIEDPLFEDDYVAILDPDLMEELAIQKLNAVAAKYADDWKWTATQTEFTWLDQQNHLTAHADRRGEFTEEETAALAEAEGTH